MVKQAKVTSKGQITIPAEVREALHLREGDRVAFEVDGQDQANSVRCESEAPLHVTPVPCAKTKT